MSDSPDWLSPRHYFQASAARPRKRFGQHFLAQPQTARRIVEALELTGKETVVEVGPGLGALTRYLVPQAGRLILVELDRELAAYLRHRLAERAAAVEVICGDILQVSLPALAASLNSRLVLVGNLPYQISSPLLFQILDAAAMVDRALFMVQREVAERLTAPPGTKTYGVLSVLVNAVAATRLLLRLGPNQFYPPPKVDSAVVAIDFTVRPGSLRPAFGTLRRVVRAAFAQRRKTLKNSLASLDRERPGHCLAILNQLGIDPERRPETLSPDQFLAIAAALEGASG